MMVASAILAQNHCAKLHNFVELRLTLLINQQNLDCMVLHKGSIHIALHATQTVTLLYALALKSSACMGNVS